MPHAEESDLIRDTASVLRRFRANEGRLFLVGDSKPFAVDALAALIAEDDIGSALVVAQNEWLAEAFGAELSERTGKPFEVVCDPDELTDGLGVTAADYRAAGKTIAERHPYLVVAVRSGTDAPREALFGAICKGDDFGFRYHFDKKQEHTDILLADLLAEAGYGLLVVDDVYACFSFADAKQVGDVTPVSAVRIDFDGKEYYSRGESYRKLKLLCDGARQVLLLSDRMLDGDVVSLYAALDLIGERFSLFKARRWLAGLCNDPSAVYEDVFNDIINSEDDPNVVNSCFHEAYEYKQTVPSSVAEMDDYIDKCVEYASQEEIVLRALWGYVRRFCPDAASIDPVLDNLESDDVQMARCICAALFGDELKGALENAHAVKAFDFDGDAVRLVREIFAAHGGALASCAPYRRATPIRIFSDDSVFEFATRDAAPETVARDKKAYESICTFDGPRKKAIAVKCLAASAAFGAGTPVLILTADADATSAVLKTELSADPNDKGFSIVCYDRFVATPAHVPCGAAVLFDAPCDPVVYRKTLGLLSATATPVFALIGRDADGMLLDAWDATAEASAAALPIGSHELLSDDGHVIRYAQIYADLCKCIRGLIDAAEGFGTERGSVAQLPEALADLLRLYRNTVPVMSEIERDTAFLTGTSKGLSRAFRNSVTIGGEGESTTGAPPRSTKQGPIVLFNACASMLTRKCDCETHDCYGCDKTLPVNRYAQFRSGVIEFYEDAARCAGAADAAAEGSDSIIRSRDGDATDAYRVLKEKLDADRPKAEDLLRTLDAVRKVDLFTADFAVVQELRTLLSDAYRSIFDKYFADVTAVFDATNERLGNYLNVLCSKK